MKLIAQAFPNLPMAPMSSKSQLSRMTIFNDSFENIKMPTLAI